MEETQRQDKERIGLVAKLKFVLGSVDFRTSGVYELYSTLAKENRLRETFFDRLRVAYQN